MFEEETNQLFLWPGQVLQCANASHPEIRFLQMYCSSTPLPVEYDPSHLLSANGTATKIILVCYLYFTNMERKAYFPCINIEIRSYKVKYRFTIYF